MNQYSEALVYLIGGLGRTLDLSTKIWYISTQSYTTTSLFILSIISLFIPFFLFLIGCLFALFSNKLGKSKIPNTQLLIVFAFIVGDFIGINYFVIGITLCISKFSSQNLYFWDSLLSISCVVNSALQTVPLIMIQFFNNQENENWNSLTFFSFGTSASWLGFTCVRLILIVARPLQSKLQISPSEQILRKRKPEGNINMVKPELNESNMVFEIEELAN